MAFKRGKKDERTQAAAEPTDDFQKAMNWEASRTEQLEKSERRAWRVAFMAGALTVLSWVAIVLMMPLKENTPYLYRENKVTGNVDIVTTLKDKMVGYDEVRDKYWVRNYVSLRERYDWWTLQNDYDTVGLYSSEEVGQEFAKLYEGDNALDKRYRDKVNISVRIISVVPTKNGTATVRLVKTMRQPGASTAKPVEQYYVATVAYEYRGTAKMKEEDRQLNPWGFQVLSYRIDPEMMGGQ